MKEARSFKKFTSTVGEKREIKRNENISDNSVQGFKLKLPVLDTSPRCTQTQRGCVRGVRGDSVGGGYANITHCAGSYTHCISTVQFCTVHNYLHFLI